MRFAFTDDQKLFAEGLRELLAKECTPDARARGVGRRRRPRLHAVEPPGRHGRVRHARPESAGGLGGTEVDLVLLLEELGRARRCRARCSRPWRWSRPRCGRRAPRRRHGCARRLARTSRTRTSRRWCSCRAGWCAPTERRSPRSTPSTAAVACSRVDGPGRARSRYDEALAFDRGAAGRGRVPGRAGRAHDRGRRRVRPPARAVRTADRRRTRR